MAIVDIKSTQYGNRDSNPPVPNSPEDVRGKLRFYRWDFNQGTVLGDAASKQFLQRIAPGRGWVLPSLSRNTWSAFGAGRTYDIGLGAYTKPDGTAVVAVVDNISDAVDVAAAGSALLGVGTNANKDAIAFNTQDEIAIIGVVAAGTIPAAATLNGWLCVVESN